MEQKKIRYKEIIDLGFEIIGGNCNVFFETYGYPYNIYKIFLTKKIYIQWHQDSRTCEMFRINSQNEADIKARWEIKDLTELKRIIKFFGK
jgi:hypothetical protein